MASTSSTPTDPSSSAPEDTAAKTFNKRYEGLVAIRSKAIKGKGAWYWAHLEPILIRNPDTSFPKAVKLKCSFCDALFSASNPSRTASEHLKRGTCPNFNSDLRPNSVVSPLPISPLPSPPSHNHRKRSSYMATPLNSLAIVESTRVCNELGSSNAALNQQQHLVLSGGKQDLGALAMLEDSIKKLKSPKASPGPSLSKDQIDSALELLADWFYETCGSVSFSSLEHPKFRAFLHQVGLSSLSRRDLSGARLENRYHVAKTEVEARIRDAMFFQVACNGWKKKNCCSGEENLVMFSNNLPNGTSLYQKVVLTGGSVSSKYAEEIMWEAVTSICGSALQRCVGIVADKYKSKALRNLEIQYQWMVNLSCQVQGLLGLIKDFFKQLRLFRTVTENCMTLANFVNNKSQVRISFQKYRMQELEDAGLLRVPSSKCECTKDFTRVYAMLEDILSCVHVLQMVVLDDSYKVISVEDSVAGEIAGMIQSEGFWNELEAVYSLTKLIRKMAHEIEAERPLIGQCLPLWEDLKAKVKDWSARFNIVDEHVEKIVEKRFRKNYHPAWSAAFILDPLYLMRDTSGKYLPPFKSLTHEQEKDVDKLITRLVSREEAHVALMEVMKWRSEGLDPLYAQAVQVKQRDPSTGKMKIAHPQGSRSSLKWVCTHRNSRVGLERAQKMIFVAAHAKLERRDFLNEEEKDGELAGCEDDMLEDRFCLSQLDLVDGEPP
ncbi:uncharacterized protein LOC110654958 isoform X4 [Hevea brasiliensis]|uniref:uncharacterized protein LOC110654958 isoform X4 n=1 Tax=Hevea brasiliensis TaxID=3981 RepID=UPI0025F8A62B|nr:uncharacterized protein LOC110654958 isoform X4 [Hevea brasiliensis]